MMKAFYYIIILLLFIPGSCRKLVELPLPVTSIPEEAIFASDETAVSAINHIYARMGGAGNSYLFSDLNGVWLATSYYTDELFLANTSGGSSTQFFTNNLVPDVGGRYWENIYPIIYQCNVAISRLTGSQTLSARVKTQLLGEAYFLRGLLFFYIANLYGDAALATSTDYSINAFLSRSPVNDVYQLIQDDLLMAKELLSSEYLNGTANGVSLERLRPTKWAASALLARVYLYNGKNGLAEQEASLVLNNTSLFRLDALNNVFLKGSPESIWQVQPTKAGENTQMALYHIIPPTGFSSSVPHYLNPSLFNSFEAGDQRCQIGKWIGSTVLNGTSYPYAFKYKAGRNSSITTATGTQNMTEFQVMLRLGEQYLVRAEARAKSGNLPGAIQDIDSIRNRAGLPLIANTNPGISQTAVMDLILKERRSELFAEDCHRFFDLKRFGKIDAVMNIEAPLKGGTWEPYKSLFPIGLKDLRLGINLIQTPGYPGL